MKGSKIFTADSYETAIELALADLKAPRSALEIEELHDMDDTLDGKEVERKSVRARVNPEYYADGARDLLLKMLKLMGHRMEVRTKIEEGEVRINLRGPTSAILIGRSGATLEALQHLINRMVIKTSNEGLSITVDVENYRQKKNAKLERQAQSAAQRVLETGEEEVLAPMSPSERKVIHLVVKEIKGVLSYSKGWEGNRQVVIAPVDPEAKSKEK
ncbi:MAG: R3H domain-containing nucleic acid-binding protein [bacterium]